MRSVAEAAQHVLLWPLPEQIGPLQVACLYLAAEDEAQIGGDLYAATRTEHATRVLIGDVRGKSLSAIGEAALLIGAFRESAHQHTTLPQLAAALERSADRYLADVEPAEEAGERFATTLLLDIPDEDPITRLTSCGHQAPLLLSPGASVTAPSVHPAPPLGIGLIEPADYTLDVNPGTLLHHIRHDLLAHAGGHLGDDAALVAIRRTPTGDQGHHPGKILHADRFRHHSGKGRTARLS